MYIGGTTTLYEFSGVEETEKEWLSKTRNREVEDGGGWSITNCQIVHELMSGLASIIDK